MTSQSPFASGGRTGSRKTPGFGVTAADGSQVGLFTRQGSKGPTDVTKATPADQRGVQIADPLAAGVVLDLHVLPDAHLNFRDFRVNLVHQEQFVSTTITLATRAPHPVACRLTMDSAHALPLALDATADGNGVFAPVFLEAQEAYEAVCLACDKDRTLPAWHTTRGTRPDIQDNTLLWTIPFLPEDTHANVPATFAHASEDGIFDAFAWFAWTHVRDILLDDPSWASEAALALYHEDVVAQVRRLLELTTTPVTTSYDARARAIELCVMQVGHVCEDARRRLAAQLCAAALGRPSFTTTRRHPADAGALALLELDHVAAPNDLLRVALWLPAAAGFVTGACHQLPATHELSPGADVSRWGFGLLVANWAESFRGVPASVGSLLAARIYGGHDGLAASDVTACALLANAHIPAHRLATAYWMAAANVFVR